MTSEDDIVQRYFNANESLRQMPARRAPRLMVLKHIVRRIPVDQDLPESVINDALRPVSPDVAMLRRYMVDEGLLHRWPPGIYRRPAGQSRDGRSMTP